jgi:PAS domain S-box-containing protein
MARSAVEPSLSPQRVILDDTFDVRDARNIATEITLATSHFTGQCYFEELVKNVAAFTGVDCVFVCELALDYERAFLIASHQEYGPKCPDEIALGSGAGERLLERGDVAYARAVLQQFPADGQLRALDAEALVGTVLRSASQDPIGVIFLVHHEPLPVAAFVDAVLQQLAPRIGAELERRQQETVIERSEARLRLLTDRSRDVIFYYQLAPTIDVLYISPAVETVFGLPQEAFHANPEIIFELLSAEYRTTFQKAFHAGSEQPLIAKINLPDGISRWVEYRVFTVRNDEKQVIGIGGNIRDVTDHMEAEETAKRSQRYLQSLLDSIPDTLLLVHSDGEVLDYVPGEVKIELGNPQQVKGRNLKDLMSPAIVGVIERAIRTASRSQRVKRVQFEVPGERAQLIDVSCLPFGDGALLLILRDLTAENWFRTEKDRQRVRDDIDERVENRLKSNLYGLTYRELAVLNLVVEGMADKQIADTLGISIFTVNKHVGNILGKMNATSRTEAGVRAIREGLLLQSP